MKRIQLAISAAVLMLLFAGWIRIRSYSARNGNESVTRQVNSVAQAMNTPFDSSPIDSIRKKYASQELGVGRETTLAPSGPPSWHGQHSPQCFSVPDYSQRPDPWADRSKWLEWRSDHPFSALLGKVELERVQSDPFLTTFNEMAHRVREQDLRDGAREEQWSRLYDLKSRSAALELQQGADKAIDLLGEPTGIVRYTVWTEGTTLMKNNSTERFSADQLSIADRPFSLRYDPEGWEHLGRGDYPFRALVLDFTADRKLFQWYFEPLPSSPDW